MSGIVAQNVGRPSGLIKAAEGGGGTWVEIKTLTSDGSDATLSFVNGTSDVVLDSTYPIYCFKCINIHPETDRAAFEFNLSVDTGSNYNVTKTSSAFRTYHDEADSGAVLQYAGEYDLAQGTGDQTFLFGIGNGNDESGSGFLYLFNPSSTTFVKHYMLEGNVYEDSDYFVHYRIAGYGNTTSAVDAIQFKFDSGEIQGGKIKLFGIKDS